MLGVHNQFLIIVAVTAFEENDVLLQGRHIGMHQENVAHREDIDEDNNMSPRPDTTPDGFDLVAEDRKCRPHRSSERLWRSEGQTLQTCADKCTDEPECMYFSIAASGESAGVCMGCVTAKFDDHEGFQAFARTPAVDTTPDGFDLVAEDRKCPHRSSERLWRDEGHTLQSCADKCTDEPECMYFSIAVSGKYAGVCMGCVTANFDDHEGFQAFARTPAVDTTTTTTTTTTITANGLSVAVTPQGQATSQARNMNLCSQATSRVHCGGSNGIELPLDVGQDDFSFQLTFRLAKREATAASVLFSSGENIGFDGGGKKLFLEGGSWGGPRHYGGAVTTGHVHKLIVSRSSGSLSIILDGQTPYPEKSMTAGITSVKVRPWRNSMEILEFRQLQAA